MANITQLPNNCYIGKVSVYPVNWKDKTASLKEIWKVQYRFYDPSKKIEKPKGKQRIIKGMNDLHTLEERRAETKSIIARELLLLKGGYNPITEEFTEEHILPEINTETPFLQALEWARHEANIVHPTKINMKSQLKFLTEAASQLNMVHISIGEIRRKHLKMLLKKVEENRPIWNNGRFNSYRRNLQQLFCELLEIEAIEFNPINDIKKKEEVEQIREVLTPGQRKLVDQHLRKKNMMPFRLYIRIFFHTGIRSTELLQVKANDVDLDRQLVKVTIRKGKRSKIVYKTIKNIAVRYWKLAIKNANPDDYIFSRRLNPGPKPINEHQISRRWLSHIKATVANGGLGITTDFYSYKHANTTEIVDEMGEEAAAGLNSHTSTAMVRKIYDTKRVSREHEKIKRAGNHY
jgi:integrase